MRVQYQNNGYWEKLEKLTLSRDVSAPFRTRLHKVKMVICLLYSLNRIKATEAATALVTKSDLCFQNIHDVYPRLRFGLMLL